MGRAKPKALLQWRTLPTASRWPLGLKASSWQGPQVSLTPHLHLAAPLEAKYREWWFSSQATACALCQPCGSPVISWSVRARRGWDSGLGLSLSGNSQKQGPVQPVGPCRVETATAHPALGKPQAPWVPDTGPPPHLSPPQQDFQRSHDLPAPATPQRPLEKLT